MLTLDGLRESVRDGEIDTVIVAMTDMQGRLQGKRFHARFFLDEVVAHNTEACAYLLAVDTDMNTVDGYQLASWETGYGDFMLVPDLATLREVPWQPGTALVLADVAGLDGAQSPVRVSPRQVLRAQLARAAELGWTAMAGTELEFVVYEGGYEQAWDSGYRSLVPANRYNADYSVLGTGRIEPLLRDIRNSMAGAGLYVESAKGECNLGQHEIAFRYADALTTADQHSIYKTGAKEIAARHGYALTFMAKPNEREGNSCHIHLSFRTADGSPVMAGDGQHGLSPAGASIMSGLLAGLRELTLLLAPTINSYKRFAPGSFAPTAVAWGPDNRTCALRLVGHGPSLRVECRVPGGDVNPYLALAGLVAAALSGVAEPRPLPPPLTGNAYAIGAAAAPAADRKRLRHRRPAAGARDAGRGAGAVGVVGVGGRRVRQGRGQPLRDDGAGRTRRVPRCGDRLGTATLLRAHLTVIGLTTYSEPATMLVWQREFAMLHSTYVAAAERAGGIAVLLPPQAAGADEVLDRVDGLVLTGGADVDPLRYGEAPGERTSAPRALRDEWETALARGALDRGLPLLAICRGLQIINVALGGSLHQHLPDLTGDERHQPGPGVFGDVNVHTEPGTRTAELLGPRTRVWCHHHQALARLAPGLTVTGRADDGTVEAVEVDGQSFAVGVQWHPEEDSGDIRLFAALVDAAGRYRQRLAEGVR